MKFSKDIKNFNVSLLTLDHEATKVILDKNDTYLIYINQIFQANYSKSVYAVIGVNCSNEVCRNATAIDLEPNISDNLGSCFSVWYTILDLSLG